MPFSGKIVRKSFLFFMSMLSTGFLVSNGSNIEARSLISFKQSSVSADPNGVLRDWILSSSTPCSWKGVSCSAHGQVIKLNLTNGGLVGQLHISHLMNMPNLAYVYLTGNYFTGNLSSTAQTCSFVNLDLSANNFSEPLDAESILSCKSLVSLNISFNSIPGGHLNFGPSLQSLDLSRNKISEFGLLNDSLNHCQNLNLLNFSDNKLHTTALNISLSHCTSLSILDLSYNIFNGAVADTFFAEAPQSLRFLDLSHNNLSDNLVSIEFGACQNLTMLDLSYNVLSAPGFSRSLSNCQSLEKLDISYNQLHQIPGQSLGELKKLRKLYLSNNNIYGEIPSELALLCGSLEELDLSANQFTGQLPSAFVSCSSLFNLNLGENKLSGDFLTSVVSHLPSMRYLYIPFNNVTGPVPRSLTNCSQLRVLDLSSNSFIGDVPFEFCTTKSVSALEKLLLPNNHLTGIIPSQLGLCRNLKVINLSFNNLSGSIPSEIWNLPSLSNLVMWANSITGDIPEGLCNNGKSLERIILNNNLITGAVPKSIANCTKLVWLSLSNNRLTGEIPFQIGNLVNLAILQLANNLLTGLLPPGLGNCSSLVWLDLNTNRLTGPIPATLADQSGLVIPRNVSGNPFALVRNENRNCRNVFGLLEFEGIREDDLANYSGIIACPFSRIYTSVTIYTFKGSGSMVFLDLSYNSLSGSIPEGIGSMTYLQVLNFGHNKLTGNIPSNFRSLKTIGVIDLSYNNLRGFIPGSLGSLSFLSNLDVSNNNLTGHIPSAGQLTTFPTSSYENNSCLCGIPMPPCGTFCGQHDISSSDDGGEEESWLISHDSFAHGFLTSFFPSFLLVFALYMWAFKKKPRRR